MTNQNRDSRGRKAAPIERGLPPVYRPAPRSSSNPASLPAQAQSLPTAAPPGDRHLLADSMFGPGIQSPPLLTDQEQPRVFDYATGINLYMQPRSGYGLLSFGVLRQFADLCDGVRIVIEAIKRELRGLEWDIQPIVDDDDADYRGEIDRLRRFWQLPDGEHEFDGWLHAVLEDLLVTDAVSLWLDVDDPLPRGKGENSLSHGERVVPEGENSLSPRERVGGEGMLQIRSVEQIDGTTIRPLLDVRGKRPAPPMPAYVQSVKGQDWQWFTSDRLLVRPYNLNSASPYGRSPIEFIILRINEALRRQESSAIYWDKTNVPEALVGVPSEWPPEQVKEFQEYFDNLLTGNPQRLRRIKFMASSTGQIPVHEFRRPQAADNVTFDEFMIRMACWAFGFNAAELGIVAAKGLGGKGFGESQENALYRFGLRPLIQYVQTLITSIIRRQTRAPLCFNFINVGSTEDGLTKAQISEIELRNGIIDVNVWRKRRGQKPIPNAKPFILVNGTPILLSDIFMERGHLAPMERGHLARSLTPTSDTAPAILDHWLTKCRRRLADGRPADCDPPDIIHNQLTPGTITNIRTQLKNAATADDVNRIFSSATHRETVTGLKAL